MTWFRFNNGNTYGYDITYLGKRTPPFNCNPKLDVCFCQCPFLYDDRTLYHLIIGSNFRFDGLAIDVVLIVLVVVVVVVVVGFVVVVVVLVLLLLLLL